MKRTHKIPTSNDVEISSYISTVADERVGNKSITSTKEMRMSIVTRMMVDKKTSFMSSFYDFTKGKNLIKYYVVC